MIPIGYSCRCKGKHNERENDMTNWETLERVIGLIETDGHGMTDGECLGAILELLKEWGGEK